MEETSNKQKEFALHEQLITLGNLADAYPQGKQRSQEIQTLRRQLVTSAYRVAVIGEFKRGKSSLLNALLGVQVLPTDILPTTGTINRIVYGLEKEMEILYKNGSREKKDLSELCHYGTKLEEVSRERLKGIREIIVRYPSLFCKNNITLIDTPGLNDDEKMTDTTLGVLTDVDTAIMVISAKMPLSMTEQSLILKLLSHREIRDITFVITFIDAVSSRRTEQDRVVDFIRQKISGDTLELAVQANGDNPVILEKAQRILGSPKLFAVSSTLAMEGFLKDDEDLLEQSRFPKFKNELFSLLTAQQSKMIFYKTADMVKAVRTELPQWHEAELERIHQAQAMNEKDLRIATDYFATGRICLEKQLMEADRQIALPELKRVLEQQLPKLKTLYVTQLSKLNSRALTHAAVASAIREGTEQANSLLKRVNPVQRVCVLAVESAQERIRARREVYQDYWGITPTYSFSHFPVLELQPQKLYPSQADLADYDVMPYLECALRAAIDRFFSQVEDFLSGWRKYQLQLLREEETLKAKIFDEVQQTRQLLAQQLLNVQVNYNTHLQIIRRMQAEREP